MVFVNRNHLHLLIHNRAKPVAELILFGISTLKLKIEPNFVTDSYDSMIGARRSKTQI